MLNLPVLLVSAFVSDRVAVAQWGLTRVVAGLLRALCVQTTLPLAAELGHDHAVGATERLRNLYARGSVFVTLLASAVVSGLLPFWQDFFALWTHGAVPYDPALAITLLIGTSAIAPAILALSYANYSNRGALLVRTKGLQLAVFLVLSLLLIPPLGPLGAAIAIVASDLSIQFGVLTSVVMQADAAAPAPARSVSGGGDDRDDAVRVGLGTGDPVGDTLDGPGTLRRRMRAMAGGCGAGCQSAGDRTRSRKTDCGDPALDAVTAASAPAGSDIARTPCSSSARQGAAIVRRR